MVHKGLHILANAPQKYYSGYIAKTFANFATQQSITEKASFWYKPESLKSEYGYSSKQTVFQRDSERTRFVASMDGFTACLRGLCLYRSNQTQMQIQQTQQTQQTQQL